MISKVLQCCTLFLVLFISISEAQQQKVVKEPPVVTMKMLAGVWQKGHGHVASGLVQNFQFSADGQFILNMGDPGEDLRTIPRVKGTYRLAKNEVFFTITSKTVLEGGRIAVGEMVDWNIFHLEDANLKEIKIVNPQELPTGCAMEVLSKIHIRFNYQDYYKIDLKKFPLGDDLYKW